MSFCTLSFFIPTSQEGRPKGKTWQESEKEESGERRKTAERAHQDQRLCESTVTSDHIVSLRGQRCLMSPGKILYQSNQTEFSCVPFTFWSLGGDWFSDTNFGITYPLLISLSYFKHDTKLMLIKNFHWTFVLHKNNSFLEAEFSLKR